MNCKKVNTLIAFFGLVGCAEAWIPLKNTPLLQGSFRIVATGNLLSQSLDNDQKKGFLEMISPYETKIPQELRDEIYAAEANTPAAKERGQRLALYVVITFAGIMSAFFNAFMTELRSNGPDGNGIDLTEAGFGWVVNNPLLSFLLLNKIGGGLSLLVGGCSGLLAEAELDTKRINAEKIYEELERRRQAKMTKTQMSSSKKKRRPGKESKRLVALSEVVSSQLIDKRTTDQDSTDAEFEASLDVWPEVEENKDFGFIGSIKSLYGQADALAASQALLLNKKLEDAGVVEKITDETGLKVIGKEEAYILARKKVEGEEK